MERPGEAVQHDAGTVRGGVGTAQADETDRPGTEPPRHGKGKPPGPSDPSRPSRPVRALRVGTAVTVVLCLMTALVHVLLVFLHVAPPNPVSQRYGRQVDAWVFPLFEQNWRLFAPDPESVNRRISARTAHTAADGQVRVSGWFDLSALDTAAVRHQVFPSHSAQNTLRRAWSSYLETHGGDDRSHSQRALMIRHYLTNIAADRIAAHRGGAFESVQLRVITVPIAAPAPASAPAPAGPGPAGAAPKPAETRYLPWWKVAPHGN